MDKLRQWLYYFIIGIVSFVALVFLPLLGSTVGLAWNIPDTSVGWIVWVATKLIIATINVLIFYSFMEQAKVNIKDDAKYLEAREILVKHNAKNVIPRSPKQWNTKQYGIKGATIFVTTALATIALTQAILAFDWVSMLTYLFTIIMGLIFGVLQMKIAENYWTDEFWRYAIMMRDKYEREAEEALEKAEREAKEALEMAEKECTEQGNDTLGDNSGVDILVTSDSDSAISLDN